jgi:hypothetical protein
MILRLITVVSTLLISLTAALGEEFNIDISNGESGLLFVVVYDMNTRG